jgi:hypothetical protein
MEILKGSRQRGREGADREGERERERERGGAKTIENREKLPLANPASDSDGAEFPACQTTGRGVDTQAGKDHWNSMNFIIHSCIASSVQIYLLQVCKTNGTREGGRQNTQ